MWDQLKRVIRPDGAIIMTGCEPFSSLLRTSNLDMYKYDWVWKKDRGSNFLNYKYQPSKNFENVMVFSKAPTSFVKKGGNCKYNPQMVSGSPYEQKQGRGGEAVVRQGSRGEKTIITKNKGDRYPNAVLSFKSEKGLHPTQKPVTLMEYLIKTYSNENEIVLDFTMGSGSTGVACVNTGRKFIGIELDPEYYGISCERII